MIAWEIFCYPLHKSRKEASYFDEVTCDKETVTTLCRALFKAHGVDKLWFYYKIKDPNAIVEHNWDITGRALSQAKKLEPVGDPTYDGLKTLLDL